MIPQMVRNTNLPGRGEAFSATKCLAETLALDMNPEHGLDVSWNASPLLDKRGLVLQNVRGGDLHREPDWPSKAPGIMVRIRHEPTARGVVLNLFSIGIPVDRPE